MLGAFPRDSADGPIAAVSARFSPEVAALDGQIREAEAALEAYALAHPELFLAAGQPGAAGERKTGGEARPVWPGFFCRFLLQRFRAVVVSSRRRKKWRCLWRA